jgi:hypothetical protein
MRSPYTMCKIGRARRKKYLQHVYLHGPVLPSMQSMLLFTMGGFLSTTAPWKVADGCAKWLWSLSKEKSSVCATVHTGPEQCAACSVLCAIL